MGAAGRAHRPGSRRLGGVEAPGASPATGASWPDRRKGWASPGRGPVLPFARAQVLAAEQAASRSLRAGALADCRSAFRLGRASITEGCAFVTRSSDRCEQQIWTRGEVREEGADGPQVLRCALRDGRTTQVRLAERLLKHRLHDFAVSVLTHQPSCRSAHTAAVYLDRLVALSQRRRLRLCFGVEGRR